LLLAVRSGQLIWKEYQDWQLQLMKEFATVWASTRLPDRPDYGRVYTFLLKARRSMLE